VAEIKTISIGYLCYDILELIEEELKLCENKNDTPEQVFQRASGVLRRGSMLADLIPWQATKDKCMLQFGSHHPPVSSNAMSMPLFSCQQKSYMRAY